VNKTRSIELHDSKVDQKVVLSGLWISTLFVFAYVDIFGFWRADVINGALDGEVPGVGFEIDQVFLTLTTVYILVPSLMVMVSLVAPARVNRVTNVNVSLLYLASIVATVVGETWAYYILGSVVEVLLLLAIARVAWMWPARSVE
jgi:ABC-type dipeptide/oligopeptide/nickel transport system permease subunit